MTLDVRPFGDRAVLIQPEAGSGGAGSGGSGMSGAGSGGAGSGGAAIRDWVLAAARAAAAQWPDAEVTAGLASILLRWPDRPVPPDVPRLLAAAMARHSDARHAAPRMPADPRVPADRPTWHRVAVRYNGPDLVLVAVALGLSTDQIVARHTGQAWTVAAVGFAPGFAYLTGEDDLFERIARRPAPRRRVPAGSVAVAAGMCAVYPGVSPGGWQLLGSTEVTLFDAARIPPARLAVGDIVTFVAVT